MTRSILYVEDEDDYQILVRRILGKAGFHLELTGTGQSGLAALNLPLPDLLILDVNLPDMDGYSLCRQVRKNPASSVVPILMLTVRRRPDEWLKGFSSGANDYLSKPLNPPELVARVKHCLSGGHSGTSGSAGPVEEGEGAEFQLVQAVVSGNQAAFEVLIQKYNARLIDSLRTYVSNGLDAEDLASLAFVKAYERLRQFRGQASFFTWLYRIAVNELQNQGRRNRVVLLEEVTRGDESAWPIKLTEPDRVSDALSVSVLHAQLHQAVAYVPRPYRQMLRWHFVRGLSYATMARRLKIPRGTVMSRLFKARQLLRKSWRRVQ